jgi:hypothetical protein
MAFMGKREQGSPPIVCATARGPDGRPQGIKTMGGSGGGVPVFAGAAPWGGGAPGPHVQRHEPEEGA